MKTLPIEIIERRHTTISIEEADRIAAERIRTRCDLQGATHIENGNLCRGEEIRAGGHSSWENTIIRPATFLDRAALLLLEQFANSAAVLASSWPSPPRTIAFAHH